MSRENPGTCGDDRAPTRHGVGGDLRQLQTHGAATAAELRAFIAKTRGQSTQEVLGMVAGSRLIRSVAIAAGATVVLLIVGTVVPWMFGRDGNVRHTVQAATDAGSAAAPSMTTRNEDGAAEPLPEKTLNQTPTPPPDAQRAVKVMGLDETKTADPEKNPLEHKLDNLLDNVK